MTTERIADGQSTVNVVTTKTPDTKALELPTHGTESHSVHSPTPPVAVKDSTLPATGLYKPTVK